MKGLFNLKKRLGILVIALTLALALLGCTPAASPTDAPTQSATTAPTPEATPEATAEPTAKPTPEPTPEYTTPVTLYLPNENVDGFITQEATTDGSAEHIVALLVAEGALPEGCALLSLQDGVADMNAAYGQAVSGTGTAGERMLVGCVVNTLLTFFDLQEISITVEGNVMESGHAIYDQPLSFSEY